MANDAPKMFWENVQQANERLVGTYILFSGKVYYVERCDNYEGVPSAALLSPSHVDRTWQPLEHEGFGSFHTLPPLGFVNIFLYKRPSAVLLTRIPERSRLHGLRPNRVSISAFKSGILAKAPLEYQQIVDDEGYQLAIDKVFPTASQILENLSENESAAFSPSYAIHKDLFGNCSLWRKHILVGMLVNNAVSFTKTTTCYLEELQQTETFNIQI